MKIPVRDDEILVLKGASEFDADLLRAAIEPLGFELYIGTRFTLIQSELKHLVVQKGVSYVWQLVRRREALLERTDNVTEIVSLLARMLDRLAPTEDFIIIDRYLLPKCKPSDYVDTLVSLLAPIFEAVRRLTLVTNSNCDLQLLTDLTARMSLLESECQIVHRTSDVFHDRFWIADRQRGLLVGTSLNGIGRRYALADYMREKDVRDVVEALVAECLLHNTPLPTDAP